MNTEWYVAIYDHDDEIYAMDSIWPNKVQALQRANELEENGAWAIIAPLYTV